MNLPGRYKKKSFVSVFIIAFILINHFGISAQNKRETPANLVQLAEHIYSTNDKLVNGVVYLPEHPRAYGSPYYPQDSYKKGNVFLNGSGFSGQQIKYNAAKQILILKSQISKSAEAEIILNNTSLDSFQLGGNTFIHAKHAGIPSMDEGYVEIIYRNDVLFMAYRKIVFQDVYSRKYPSGRYAMLPSIYYLVRGDSVLTINNKRDFYALFPGEKKNIKKYIRKQKIKFKKASGEELKALIKFCESQ